MSTIFDLICCEKKQQLSSLREIWETDEVLKLLIVDFSSFEKDVLGNLKDKSQFGSLILDLYNRGKLEKLLTPFKHFLIYNGKVRDNADKSFLNNYPEKWMPKKGDEGDLNQGFKSWFGKIVEILFAYYLYNENYTKINLEALGGTNDITCKSPEGKETSVEIKFIGQDRGYINELTHSKDKDFSGLLDVYSASDFLLLKMLDISKQFKSSGDSLKIGVIVILANTHDAFTFGLLDECGSWIEQNNFNFFNYTRKKQEGINRLLKNNGISSKTSVKEELEVVNKYEYYLLDANLDFSILKEIPEKLRIMIDILRGQYQRVIEPININDILKSALNIFKITALEITTDYSDDIPNIHGDKRDMQILFINLFKNAMEAYVENTMIRKVAVRTSYSQKNQRVYVQISDSGIGMSEDTLKMFKSSKMDGLETTKDSGNGIGLMVVKRVLSEHNGKMDVSSHEGLGTTFTLIFPGKDNKSSIKLSEKISPQGFKVRELEKA
ncbi:MAG: GHKL domain-containing protein [Candidatus Margulisbacteria bacterium]|nr:GHKL domain-containing protein [Candidatus Margulisiibacteriota bacterium]